MGKGHAPAWAPHVGLHPRAPPLTSARSAWRCRRRINGGQQPWCLRDAHAIVFADGRNPHSSPSEPPSAEAREPARQVPRERLARSRLMPAPGRPVGPHCPRRPAGVALPRPAGTPCGRRGLRRSETTETPAALTALAAAPGSTADRSAQLRVAAGTPEDDGIAPRQGVAGWRSAPNILGARP